MNDRIESIGRLPIARGLVFEFPIGSVVLKRRQQFAPNAKTTPLFLIRVHPHKAVLRAELKMWCVREGAIL